MANLASTVKPHNRGQLKQLDFFRYCGVFCYFEGLETLNRAFLGWNLSAIAGFSATLKSAVAGFYCIKPYAKTNKRNIYLRKHCCFPSFKFLIVNNRSWLIRAEKACPVELQTMFLSLVNQFVEMRSWIYL